MTLAAGFADPVFQSQAVFRAVAAAMAEPGRPVALASDLAPPAPLLPTTAAVLLTLIDFETPVWLDDALGGEPVSDWLRFNTACPLVATPEGAAFAVLADPAACPAFDVFAQGTAEYPDRSTTLILQVQAMTASTGQRLSGPGIDGEIRFDAMPLPDGFWTSVADNRSLFPLGVDVILCAADAIAALPRSVRPLGEVR
ncbi:MAG: phosphonate C-P lyase system protein PhnH [Hyphomicrobiales bacterium]|nr:MAG: phosphonate C-P lyase system protein PhnH [Hyphomicrobiales bacterium]